MDEGKEEDFTMLIRKIGKMFYKKGRMSNFQRKRPLMKSDREKEEMDLYFHCKKTGHLIANYPSLQAITSKRPHKQKVMVATWNDSKIESDKEVDIANNS